MPELPEVETIRRELEREAVGKRIKSVEVHGTRTVRRQTKKAFIAKLEGMKITGVDRRGKYLVVKLDSGDVLVIHLRMSGQLLRAAAKEPMAKHTHVVITFTQGGQLRFIDPRTFGEMFVTSPDDLTADVPELAELGFDPVENPISWTVFGQLLVNRQMKLKTFLTDQTIIAGLGNIYADEILFAAGSALRPPVGLAVHPGDPPAVPVGGGDPPRGHQVRRLHARRRAVRRPQRQAG